MLSNGDARIATTTSNTAAQKTLAQGTVSSDPDLQALSTAAGYSQALKDEVLLTFDITPTVSGPLAFQYVWGSEEYPDFAPSPGEWSLPSHCSSRARLVDVSVNAMQGCPWNTVPRQHSLQKQHSLMQRLLWPSQENGLPAAACWPAFYLWPAAALFVQLLLHRLPQSFAL